MNNLIMLLIFVPILSLVLLFVNVLLSSHRPDEAKVSAYECGFSVIHGQTRATFQIHFYIVAMLFLVFDLEILILYPVGAALYSVSTFGFTIAIIFFLILTIGFVLEIGSGAISLIDFEQPIQNSKENNKINPNDNKLIIKLNFLTWKKTVVINKNSKLWTWIIIIKETLLKLIFKLNNLIYFISINLIKLIITITSKIWHYLKKILRILIINVCMHSIINICIFICPKLKKLLIFIFSIIRPKLFKIWVYFCKCSKCLGLTLLIDLIISGLKKVWNELKSECYWNNLIQNPIFYFIVFINILKVFIIIFTFINYLISSLIIYVTGFFNEIEMVNLFFYLLLNFFKGTTWIFGTVINFLFEFFKYLHLSKYLLVLWDFITPCLYWSGIDWVFEQIYHYSYLLLIIFNDSSIELSFFSEFSYASESWHTVSDLSNSNNFIHCINEPGFISNAESAGGSLSQGISGRLSLSRSSLVPDVTNSTGYSGYGSDYQEDSLGYALDELEQSKIRGYKKYHQNTPFFWDWYRGRLRSDALFYHNNPNNPHSLPYTDYLNNPRKVYLQELRHLLTLSHQGVLGHTETSELANELHEDLNEKIAEVNRIRQIQIQALQNKLTSEINKLTSQSTHSNQPMNLDPETEAKINKVTDIEFWSRLD